MPNLPAVDLVVRGALHSDALRMALLFEQLGYPDASHGLDSRLAQQLLDPSNFILVAARDSDVIGVLVMHVLHPLHVARPWALVSSLVTDEVQRSAGTGAALLAAAEAAARHRGCAHLELSCSERRTRAHAFYEAQGFSEVRKRFVKKII
jgi:GNAT superfamily N-acetyltransferase